MLFVAMFTTWLPGLLGYSPGGGKNAELGNQSVVLLSVSTNVREADVLDGI